MEQFAQGVTAADGKALRRSYDRAEGPSALNMVSAWPEDQGLVLGQLAVNDKSNKITAGTKLLEMPTLRNMVVTADARHCQRQIAQQVVDQSGDYALVLKGNQGSLRDGVGLFLDGPATPVAQAAK